MIDVNKLGKLVEEKGEDQSEASAGGGGFEIPPAGRAMVRFVEYVEMGKVKSTFKDKKTGKEVEKTNDSVMLGFELRGANFPATNEETGREDPFVIRIFMNKSTNEKANFFKLFAKLRAACKKDSAKHMVQLLGSPMVATVYHKDGTGNSVGKTFANLHDEDGVYSFREPVLITETEEGETIKKPVKVPEAITQVKAFLWDLADKDQWDSIFIDGKTEERTNDKGEVIPGKSKNWMQNKIKEAINFKGSPIAGIVGGGDDLDVGEAETPKRKPAKDPLEEDGGTNKVEDDLNDEVPF